MSNITTRLDNFGHRLAAVEGTTKAILESINKFKADSQSSVLESNLQHIPPDQLFRDIQEAHRIATEELQELHRVATGPGNFATKLVRRLYPELFDSQCVRLKVNYYGGPAKKELDPLRKALIKRYVTAFFPSVKPVAIWKQTVVSKINDFLRRPDWEKRKSPARKSAAVTKYRRRTCHPASRRCRSL